MFFTLISIFALYALGENFTISLDESNIQKRSIRPYPTAYTNYSKDYLPSTTPLTKWDHRHERMGIHWDAGYAKKLCLTGRRQSPVDIRPLHLDFKFFSPIELTNYEKPGSVKISNSGKLLEISGFEDRPYGLKPYISGGGLTTKYLLESVHFHWGRNSHEGSEHTIGTLSFPGEIHFVHVKEGLTMEEAQKLPDGLAVLSVFMQIGLDTTHLKRIAPELLKITKAGASTKINGFILNTILPPVITNFFFRYNGSLTTPPCSEAVVWTVFAEPIFITKTQLDLFHQLKGEDGKPILSNFRPTQPLNGRRIIYRSPALSEVNSVSSNDGDKV